MKRTIALAERVMAGGLFALWLSASAPALALETSQGRLAVEPVVTGLDQPWGFDFLPSGGGLLVTERDGRLLHIGADGGATSIDGVPEVFASEQGGLLDVAVAADFAASREIFLTYAAPQPRGGAGTALAVARLSEDAQRVEGLRVLFEAAEGFSGGRHFGSRVVEGRDGHLYVTIGDRGERRSAQDLGNHNGTVVRVARDGTVPASNPFVGRAGARPEIWSYGHRNPQGAALDASGQLWTVEHGARGGDEVNRVERGANYGWPVISYGRHYSGLPIGQGTEAEGMEQPLHYWDPSIAPSGLMIYSGALWPEWEGDFFAGSLNSGLISRIDGATFEEVERIEGPETERVRDIAEGPGGAIWFLSVGTGTLWRVTPR